MILARGTDAGSGRGRAGPDLWTAFWRDFGSAGKPQQRCHVPAGARAAIDRHWARFADGLPRGANILDLGCGAGVVGRALLDRRADLRVTGVDWAGVPPACRPNLDLCPGIDMAALPFADRSFDAAVSLFGIEYGKGIETVGELSRVARPGAPFSFLIHHRDSEIVREGVERRRVLKALTSGPVRNAFLSGNATATGRQLRALRTRFPADRTIGLAASHLHRNLVGTRADRQRVWQDLDSGLGVEIVLLQQLDKSAKSPDELAAWLAPLIAGMTLVSAAVLRGTSGEPIAWSVAGMR